MGLFHPDVNPSNPSQGRLKEYFSDDLEVFPPSTICKKILNERKPMIILHTNKGDIKIELDFDKAPVTAKNFEQYVKDRLLRRRNLPPRHQRLHDSRRRHG